MSNPITKHPRIGDSGITVDDAIPALSVTTAMLAAGAVTGAKASATLSAMRETESVPTVAATGTTEILLIAPAAGSLILAKVVFKDALTQHAANYLSFAIVNKGQAGAGSTAMLAATDANTTKTSTGTAIGAYTPRTLALHGTPANLVVAAGDCLAIQFISAATLANTLTEGNVKLVFSNVA